MCTSISFKTKDHYFGRNLDYEFSYNETVTVTPRNYPLNFRKVGAINSHYAIIGMAFVQNDYPLYYDATNEKGLSMAGLNFPKFAVYHPLVDGKDNVTPFEFIPWILSQCATVDEARVLLGKMSLYNENFFEQLPLSPLHWHIADEKQSIVVESVADGLKIYDNPVGVMTNSPTFDFHLLNLSHYMGATREIATNRFAQNLGVTSYSRGMGGFGIPGDLSSASRFVRAAFTLNNSVVGDGEKASVSHFFHILGSVAQQKGCCAVDHGYEYTIYSSCCNTSKGIYYYTTYENSQPTAVDMHHTDLDGKTLVSYPLVTDWNVNKQN